MEKQELQFSGFVRLHQRNGIMSLRHSHSKHKPKELAIIFQLIFNGTGCYLLRNLSTRNIIMVAVIADWFPITTKDSESTTTKISKHIATKYSKYASEKHSKSTSAKDSKSTITENSTSLTSDVSKSPRTENRNQWNQENSRVYIRHTKASETS